MNKETEETTKGILQRITSPWFFTFIPWWVVLNYDFLILVFGEVNTLDNVRKYYKCDFINTKLSIFGCIDFYGWGNNQFLWKLAFPVIATLLSMTVITKMISYYNEKFSYYSLNIYERQTKCEKEMQQIDRYTQQLSSLCRALDNTIDVVLQEKRLYEEGGKTFPDEVLLDRIQMVKEKSRHVSNVLDEFYFVRRYLFRMQNNSVRYTMYNLYASCKKSLKNTFKQKTK